MVRNELRSGQGTPLMWCRSTRSVDAIGDEYSAEMKQPADHPWLTEYSRNNDHGDG